MASERYDVIIIGTGAGGGTLAYRLAPSGKRILLLERGHFLPRERDNWDPTAVFVQSKYKAQETWYGKDGRAFHPGIHYYVGGNTKFYGAALFRLREEDFGEIRHHGGISPAWPIGYADFEPYYSEAEQLYHVHGEHGADPPTRQQAGPILIRRSRTSRASRSFTTGCGPVDTTRSRCLSGSFWTKQRGSRSTAAPASAAVPSTAIRA